MQDATKEQETKEMIQQPDKAEARKDDAPPAVVGEAPRDPAFIGNLLPQEMGQLGGIRQQMTGVKVQIADMELQKSDLLYQFSLLQDQYQAVTARVSERMGIAKGQRWVVTQDGRAMLVPDKSGFPPVRMAPAPASPAQEAKKE